MDGIPAARDDRPVRILSIDGGGIRGLIPALVLAGIERRSGRPIANSVDLIAGTSTGGILACALTVPEPIDAGRPRYSAQELVGLYDAEGPEIFSRTLWRRIQTAWGALDERYANAGLRDALQRRLGEVPLSGIVPGTEILLTAYDLERRKVTLLRSARARAGESASATCGCRPTSRRRRRRWTTPRPATARRYGARPSGCSTSTLSSWTGSWLRWPKTA